MLVERSLKLLDHRGKLVPFFGLHGSGTQVSYAVFQQAGRHSQHSYRLPRTVTYSNFCIRSLLDNPTPEMSSKRVALASDGAFWRLYSYGLRIGY